MTILVAVSRDHTRERVLDVAVRLAGAFGQDLYIVHLIEDESPPSDPSQIREELRQRVLDENVVATVAVEPVGPTLARAGTEFGQALLELAADVDVTHIVMGHTPKGFLADAARGNTAFTVADAAHVPVTIIPEPAVDPAA